mmetsp:Transcript_7050/g.12010  ORF Transcript_7050/g.12010 Transcript_7050/m.12010 type:complete len:94 (-) Transcript_7050:61-342(-)
MQTLYPRADRCSAVAQPQYPSPPMIITRVPPPLLEAVPAGPAGAESVAADCAMMDDARSECIRGRAHAFCTWRDATGMRVLCAFKPDTTFDAA